MRLYRVVRYGYGCCLQPVAIVLKAHLIRIKREGKMTQVVLTLILVGFAPVKFVVNYHDTVERNLRQCQSIGKLYAKDTGQGYLCEVKP